MRKPLGNIAITGLSLALCLGTAVPAFAVEGAYDYAAPTVDAAQQAQGTATLTVKDAVDGHTYSVYQIFTGTLDESGTKLSDMKFGANYGDAGASATDAYAALEQGALSGKTAAEIAKYFAGELDGDPVAQLTAENPSAELATGYYLVVDTSSSSAANDMISEYVISLVGATTFTPKTAGAPDADKVMYDADGNEIASDTSVDFANGEAVSFSLKAVLPENLASFETYKLVFNDALTNLDLDAGSIQLLVNGTPVSMPDDAVAVAADGGSFTVSLDDAKGLAGVQAGSTIEVRYTATVTVDAVERTASNTYVLNYSNDPTHSGQGDEPQGTTPEDEVTIFTFALDFDKVNGADNAPLAGAGFTLYQLNDEGEYVAVGDEVRATGDAGNEFSIAGLAAGRYKLVETTTPDGFNTMDDLEFSIVAASQETFGGAEVTTFQMLDADGNALDGWTAENQVLSADVANFAGTILPSSGGIGTTMFYVVGGIVVVGAGFLLVMKRRKSGMR